MIPAHLRRTAEQQQAAGTRQRERLQRRSPRVLPLHQDRPAGQHEGRRVGEQRRIRRRRPHDPHVPGRQIGCKEEAGRDRQAPGQPLQGQAPAIAPHPQRHDHQHGRRQCHPPEGRGNGPHIRKPHQHRPEGQQRRSADQRGERAPGQHRLRGRGDRDAAHRAGQCPSFSPASTRGLAQTLAANLRMSASSSSGSSSPAKCPPCGMSVQCTTL